MKFFAFIPARSGSKRVINKNARKINGKTLIEIAVKYAMNSSYISNTFIVTDSAEYERLATSFGAYSLGLRPQNISSDVSSDMRVKMGSQ